MKGSEQILTAMSGIGEDLVIMAEHQHFGRSIWQQILPLAACLLIVIGSITGLKKLPTQPIYTVPPPEAEPPAEIELPPTEPETPPEDSIAPEETTEIPYYTKELETPAFYIFDTDATTDSNPSKAIAPDGTVLVSAARGEIEPLIDHATGEYIAIMVYHRADGETVLESTCDIYNLQGEHVTAGLQAYDVDCFGQVILVLSESGGETAAALYRRDDHSLIRGGFKEGMVLDGCIWMLDYINEFETVQYVVDDRGNIQQVPKPVRTYFTWDGSTYFVTQQEDGLFGLMNSDCDELLQKTYAQIGYGISCGYAICEDAEGFHLVDVTTGEEAFHWPHAILAAYPEYVLVQTEECYALTDWNGTPVAEANIIREYDDDKDGQPELYLCKKEDTSVYLCPDGSVLAAVSRTGDTWFSDLLNSRTMLHLNTENGELEIQNLLTGNTVLLNDHAYATWSPIQVDDHTTGMFFALYEDGDNMRCSILQEDGTVVLDGLSGMWTRQGDAFYTEADGMAGLIRIDGTWIYQEPLP